MIELIVIAIVMLLIIIISKMLGDIISKCINFPFKHTSVFGFLVLLGTTFIPQVILIFLNVDVSISHGMLIVFFILIIIAWFVIVKRLKVENTSILIVGVVAILLLISAFFAIGEKLGDSVFYFNLVGKNITGLINKSVSYNGLEMLSSNTGAQYGFSNFYHLFATLSWLAQSIMPTVNHSVILNWGSNLLFFYFTTSLIVNLLDYYKVTGKIVWVAGLTFCLGYWTTLYYNITLAHIGVTFLAVPILALFLTAKFYFDNHDKRVIPIMMLLIMSMFSFSSTGFFLGSMLVMALLINAFYQKNEHFYELFVALITPVLVFVVLYYQQNHFIVVGCLVAFVISIAFKGLIIGLLNKMSKHRKIITYCLLISIFVLMTAYGICKNGGLSYISQFWAKMSHIDRVQDYYLFEDFYQGVANIMWYIMIIVVLTAKKLKNMRFVFVTLIVCFINPFVIVYIKDFITQVVYYRVNYLIFNIFIFVSAIAALDNNKMKSWLSLTVISLSVMLMWSNLAHYFHEGYIPGHDFNVVYKLDNQVVEIGLKLNEITKIEKKGNVKVISQIYGITMLAPSINSMFSPNERREQGAMFPKDSNMSELYKIFYSPAFVGDDFLRHEADYQNACRLLIEEEIDFIIVRKDLNYINAFNDWVPLSWAMRDCADKVYQNEGYELFRFYW